MSDARSSADTSADLRDKIEWVLEGYYFWDDFDTKTKSGLLDELLEALAAPQPADSAPVTKPAPDGRPALVVTQWTPAPTDSAPAPKCAKCGSVGDVVMLCAGCQSPLHPPAQTECMTKDGPSSLQAALDDAVMVIHGLLEHPGDQESWDDARKALPRLQNLLNAPLSPVQASDLVRRLRERAKAAREEMTGTALGDALHFEEAADELELLLALPQPAQAPAATNDLKEQIAINLWHRFAPEGHMEWSEERHAAEYRDAADAVLFLARSAQPTQAPAVTKDGDQ